MAEERKLLAKVEDACIYEDQVVEFIKRMDSNLVQQFKNTDGIANVIGELVHQELLLLDAKKHNYEEEKEFKDALELTKDNLLKSYSFSKVLEGINVTEEEARDYYEKNKKLFNQDASATASHILVETEEKAKEIKAALDNGENFEKLAKEYSTCPSKENGGNLGTFRPGQMVKPFDEAVFSMEVGTISEPIKTEFGYHIIQLHDRKDGRQKEFDEVKDLCMQEALRLKQKEAYLNKIEDLKKEYTVTYY